MAKTTSKAAAEVPETPATPPGKVSSAALFERFDALQLQLKQVLGALYRPQPMYVYKPQGDTQGVALKLQLRLSPVFSGNDYPDDVEGGLFLELVAQTGQDESGFAKFGWQDDTKLTAKLGLPDISAMLAGYRSVRLRGKPTPMNTRSKLDEAGTTVSMFHKFDKDTAVIEWRFDANGSFLQISRAKDWRRSARLTLQEEIQLESYLSRALHAYHTLGCR